MTAPTALLTPQPLYLEVAELIRQRIYQRVLQPGEWIDELKLAEGFGISRTPMREALKVLAAEGLITIKPRRGAYVTEVTEQELRDVYHLLSLLESDAAALVARSATNEQLQQLQHLHDALGKVRDDADKFFRLNEQFHLLILELCGNRYLHQTVIDLRKLMKLHRHQSLFKQGRIEDSYQEHGHMLEALSQRNPEATRVAVQQHFEQGLIAATPGDSA